jgi:hypothetical protein
MIFGSGGATASGAMTTPTLDIEAGIARFDSETSRREWAMKCGSFPADEIRQYVESREILREGLVARARRENDQDD